MMYRGRYFEDESRILIMLVTWELPYCTVKPRMAQNVPTEREAILR